MKVVLLADVKKIGRKYDIANVSDGYGLNFLLPQKKAVPATAKKIKWAEDMKKNAVSTKEIQATLLAKNIDSIKSAVVEISEKVNDQGHLFAGIHEGDLAKALSEKTNIEIDQDFIVLDKAIKEVGEHDIKVVAGDMEATFKLIVSASE